MLTTNGGCFHPGISVTTLSFAFFLFFIIIFFSLSALPSPPCGSARLSLSFSPTAKKPRLSWRFLMFCLVRSPDARHEERSVGCKRRAKSRFCRTKRHRIMWRGSLTSCTAFERKIVQQRSRGEREREKKKTRAACSHGAARTPTQPTPSPFFFDCEKRALSFSLTVWARVTDRVSLDTYTHTTLLRFPLSLSPFHSLSLSVCVSFSREEYVYKNTNV